jgi:hypothetical protein
MPDPRPRVDVGPACHAAIMTNSRRVRGIELRYLLTTHLFQHGPATITELVSTLALQGFVVGGRASKSVSDALRWEIARGRVQRLARARYGPGYMPRGTEQRIHHRVLVLCTDARAIA